MPSPLAAQSFPPPSTHAHMMEESVTHIVLGVHVGARLLQTLHHRQVALACCPHQRRPANLRTRKRTRNILLTRGRGLNIVYSLIKAFLFLVHICSKILFSHFRLCPCGFFCISRLFRSISGLCSAFSRRFLCIRPEMKHLPFSAHIALFTSHIAKTIFLTEKVTPFASFTYLALYSLLSSLAMLRHAFLCAFVWRIFFWGGGGSSPLLFSICLVSFCSILIAHCFQFAQLNFDPHHFALPFWFISYKFSSSSFPYSAYFCSHLFSRFLSVLSPSYFLLNFCFIFSKQ